MFLRDGAAGVFEKNECAISCQGNNCFVLKLQTFAGGVQRTIASLYVEGQRVTNMTTLSLVSDGCVSLWFVVWFSKLSLNSGACPEYVH